MSKSISVLLIAALSIMSGCAAQDNKPDTTANRAPQQDSVTAAPFFVDVRTPEEFASGSVPGAVNIPLDEIESRIAEFEGKKEIVVFCRSGNRSAQAITILQQHGITNTTNGGSWTDVKTKYGK